MNKEPKQIRISVSIFFNSKKRTDTIGILWDGYLEKRLVDTSLCQYFLEMLLITGHFSKLYKTMRFTACKRLSLLEIIKRHTFTHSPFLKTGNKRERERERILPVKC